MPKAWRQVMRRAMAQDFSWERAAQRYIELYREAPQARRRAHAT